MIDKFATRRVKMRLFYAIVLILIGFSFMIRGYLLANRWLDPDETQHLHAAWSVAQGDIPYRDFWENHTPLFYYTLSPLILLFDEGVTVIFVARALMIPLVFGLIYLTYKIAKICYGRQEAILGVLMLTYMVPFNLKTTEVRPDIVLALLALLSLYLFIRAFQSTTETDAETIKGISGVILQPIRFSWLIASGCCLGIAALFSLKALFPFMALSLIFLIFCCLHREIRIILEYAKYWLFFFGAFCSPILLCLAFFMAHGVLRDFIHLTIIDSFTYTDRFSPISSMIQVENIGSWVMILAGMFITIRDFVRRRKICVPQGIPLISCLVIAFIYFFLMPAPYSQTQLLFLPLAAMFGGIFLKWIVEKTISPLKPPIHTAIPESVRRLLCVSTLTVCYFTGIFVPFYILLLKAEPFNKTNERQLETIEFVLKSTSESDVVFDGQGLYVFRPHAYYYCNLVKGIRVSIKNGTIPNNLSENLINRQCKIVIYDYRVRDLPDAFQKFFKANYIKIMNEIYVAGKHLTKEMLLNQPLNFQIFVRGTYTVKVKGDNPKVFIDEQLCDKTIFLDSGRHVLTFEGDLDEVTMISTLGK